MDDAEYSSRMQREVVDSYDEELELELEDRPFGSEVALTDQEKLERRRYFAELLRLQGELVKLQDWVVANGHKIVILFEGRDAAGKGGVIKRITQRLNPRVCRVAALPAPNGGGEHQADRDAGEHLDADGRPAARQPEARSQEAVRGHVGEADRVARNHQRQNTPRAVSSSG